MVSVPFPAKFNLHCNDQSPPRPLTSKLLIDFSNATNKENVTISSILKTGQYDSLRDDSKATAMVTVKEAYVGTRSSIFITDKNEVYQVVAPGEMVRLMIEMSRGPQVDPIDFTDAAMRDYIQRDNNKHYETLAYEQEGLGL